LAFALATLLIPTGARADFLDDDLWYAFEPGSETEVCVSGLRNTSATHISIPSTVVCEWEEVADGETNVYHRTCHVTSIGNDAFRDCTSLASVTIGDGVTSIGNDAFYKCSSLASVTILGNVTNDWSYSPFSGCTNLATIVLDGEMTKIGARMFYGLRSLASVTIPDSVTSIGGCAFQSCISLASVTIPDSVTSIGNGAFYDCSSLASVTIGDGVTRIGEDAFRNCTSLASVTIGDGVTDIGSSAFSSCSGMTNVALGCGVTNIADTAFYNCGAIEAFSVSGDNPAFRTVDGLLLSKDGTLLLFGVNGEVAIPDGVTDVGRYAFYGRENLTSVTIPESVERLPTTAFDGCSKLWTAWYRTLANQSAGGGQTVSLSVTNVVVHYVTQSVASEAVIPSTNSTGIVAVLAEVVAPTPIAISADWAAQYPDFASRFGSDFASALTMETGKADGAGKPMAVWQDYVAGTDPTDPTSVFTASLVFDAETGEPVISWSPELSESEAAKRVYTVSGKVRLTDPEWTAVDGNAADFNFFRVSVEMK